MTDPLQTLHLKDHMMHLTNNITSDRMMNVFFLIDIFFTNTVIGCIYIHSIINKMIYCNNLWVFQLLNVGWYCIAIAMVFFTIYGPIPFSCI